MVTECCVRAGAIRTRLRARISTVWWRQCIRGAFAFLACAVRAAYALVLVLTRGAGNAAAVVVACRIAVALLLADTTGGLGRR